MPLKRNIGSGTGNARSIAALKRHARARRLKGASVTERQTKRTTKGKKRTMKGARATQRQTGGFGIMNLPTAGQKFQAWRDLNTSFRHYCGT